MDSNAEERPPSYDYPAIMPAVLIEAHYISSSAESIRFSMDATIERFCGAVERALVEFLAGP